MPTAAVVLNPTKLDRVTLAGLLDPALQEEGWGEALWLETSPDSPGTEQAREAVERGCDLVFAVGGDGTVRAVAQGLEGTGVTMAIVPRGTGNLFAHHLKLPVGDVAACIAAGLNGTTRPIDLGVIDWTRPDESKERHVFLVIAGMGLDAQIMQTTDPVLKKRIGALAYVKAGAIALLNGKRMKLQFRIDGGEPKITKVHTVMVGNIGSIARGVTVMPDASDDDGFLDVVAARPYGPAGWFMVGWRVLVDNRFLRRMKPKSMREHDDNALELRYLQCRHIDVVLKEPEAIQLDGDHFGEVRAVSIEVAPGALLIKDPAEAIGSGRAPDWSVSAAAQAVKKLPSAVIASASGSSNQPRESPR